MILRIALINHINDDVYMNEWNDVLSCPGGDIILKTGCDWMKYWYQTKADLLDHNCDVAGNEFKQYLIQVI